MFEFVTVLSQFFDFLCTRESGNLSKRDFPCPYGFKENGECIPNGKCDNEPCMNDGFCINNLSLGFECWCLTGYSSKNCTVLPDDEYVLGYGDWPQAWLGYWW